MTANLNLKNKIYHGFFPWLFIVFMAYDLFAKILSHNEIAHIFYQIATIFKAACLALFFIFEIQYYKKDKTFILSFLLLIIVAILNHFIINYSYDFQEILFNGYYLTTQLIFIFLYKMINQTNSKFDYGKFIRLFKWFIIINIIIIWVGFFFDIGLLKAYFKSGYRFGFIGVLLYHLEAGYIFFLALIIFYFDYLRKKRIKDILTIILLLVTVPIVGTKKYFFLSIIFILYIVIVEGKKILLKKQYYKLTFSFVFICIIALWFKNIFFSKWEVIIDVYERSGIISAIFSYRDLLLTDNVIPFINKTWQNANYIFGGPVFKYHRTELEFIDTYFFYGILGLVVFYIFFRKIYRENKANISRFTITALLITAALGGNLLTSINTALLCFVALKYFELNLQKNNTIQ